MFSRILYAFEHDILFSFFEIKICLKKKKVKNENIYVNHNNMNYLQFSIVILL